MKIDDAEKHALVEASCAFSDHGFEFPLPWEGDMDDEEKGRFDGLLKACRAYHKFMQAHSR